MKGKQPNYESFLAELKRKKGRARLEQMAKRLGTGKADLLRMLRSTLRPEVRENGDWVELVPSSAIHIETRCGLEFRSMLNGSHEAKRFTGEKRFSEFVFLDDARLDKAISSVATPFSGRASNAHVRKALDESFFAARKKGAVLVSNDEDFVAFSSGFFNDYGQPLFCLSRRHPGYPKPYKFVGLFSDGSSRLSSIQVRAFNELPRQTELCELSVEFREMFGFDGGRVSLPLALSAVAVDYAHISSRIDRFPRTFWEKIYGKTSGPLGIEAENEAMSFKAVDEVRSLMFPSKGRQKAYEAVASEVAKSLNEIKFGRLSPRWFPYGSGKQGAFLVPLFENGSSGAPVYMVVIAYESGRLHAKTVYDKSIVDFDCGRLFAA